MAVELNRTNGLLLSRAEELEADALVLLNNDDTAAALAVLRKAGALRRLALCLDRAPPVGREHRPS